MAPALAVGTLLPPRGTLGTFSAPFLLDDGTGAVKTSIIVFAIFGILCSVTILVLILRRRSKSPLPPVQPLAHYRERELKYLPRPYLPHKSMGFDDHNWNEKVSLEPLRMPSFRSIDSSSTPSSACRSVPGSHTPPTVVAALSYPSSVEPQSDEPASTAQKYISTARLARSSSLSRSRSRHDFSRKLSTISARTTSTHISMRSLGVTRGAPHCSYNNIEIVLPVPLAPQLKHLMTRNPSAIQSNRQWPVRPISDGWMGATTSWPPHTDQNFLVGDASPEQLHRLGYGCKDRQGQLRRSGSQPRSRFLPLIQPKPQITDNQPRLPRVAFHVSRDRKGAFVASPPR